MRTWGYSTHVKSQVEWCMPIVPRLGGRGRRILRTLLARFWAVTGIYDTGWQYICDFVLFKSLVCNHDETFSSPFVHLYVFPLSPLSLFLSFFHLLCIYYALSFNFVGVSLWVKTASEKSLLGLFIQWIYNYWTSSLCQKPHSAEFLTNSW